MYNPSNFWGSLQEGWGVCYVRAQLPKPKAVTQNLTDTTSPKQQQKHLIPTHAPHRHTPLNNYLITKKETASQSPLSRGETNPYKSLITNKKHPPDIHVSIHIGT